MMQRVVCGICGRVVPLQPGETRPCPSCGNSVAAIAAQGGAESSVTGTDDGTTRPVDPAVVPLGPPMPAQPAPLWGTAPLPAHAPPGEPAAPSGGAPPWPGDPTTQPMPPGYVAPPPRKRSRVPLVLSVLALVLLLAVLSTVGVLAAAGVLPIFGARTAPTATPGAALTPTPTIPAGYVVYRDSQGVYQIYRPSAWSVEQQSALGGTGIALVKPNSSIGLVIVQVPLTGTTSNQALADAELQQLSLQGTVTNRQHLPDRTVGGASWAQGAAEWQPSQQGAGLEHVTVLATVRGAHAFVIMQIEPQGGARGEDQAAFARMLASFTFLT
jgi:hypothetical protein